MKKLNKEQIKQVFTTLVEQELTKHKLDPKAPLAVKGNDKDGMNSTDSISPLFPELSEAVAIEIARLANAKQILLYLAEDGREAENSIPEELAPFAEIPNDDVLGYLKQIAGDDDLIRVWNDTADDYWVENMEDNLSYDYRMVFFDVDDEYDD
ncbi:hypothetical protein [Limosilactobacillus mucosae]|uniref:Uncharacterized protein n=1 Tax=Limosilactobacillus mucosae TaxID=97478 RepID=A0AAJ1MA98_LIMMU|nr:hypothetical protein [Limosilactobacillus mucosae]MDC2828508.1 hypothetical protein [Limosilactobacillus mucosae]MDC2834520.1 hypothetical protein [Limosilactobacillus mucosae]